MNATPFHWRHRVTFADLAAELAREVDFRKRTYPGRVTEGRMTQEEADYQLTLALAWAEDVQRLADHHAGIGGGILRGDPIGAATHGLSWTQRRSAIDRELAFRARVFGRRVAEGAMTRADALHRTSCLQALADRYDEGFDWSASNGAAPSWAALDADPAARQARDEWANHWQAVEARRNPATQGEMAL